MLHVKEEAKKKVHPRELWIALLVVAVPLCAVGIYTIQTGHVPEVPGWFLAIPLGIVWAGAIINLVRHRRVFLAPMYLMYLVGYSLFATAKLSPHWWRGIADPDTVGFIGTLLWLIPALSPFIGIGKKQSAPEIAEVEPERIAAR